MFELREARDWLPGSVLHGDGAQRVTSVSTDTRTIAPGALYVALRGEHHDGHDFIAQARAAGAAAVLVESWRAAHGEPALEVADTRRALSALALAWRARFAIPVIAVAGANGKTTAKEMIAAILAERFGTHARLATAGNLNNDIGVPLSALRLRDAHQAAVLELGTNRPGEIAALAAIVRPGVALVTNAQREHQEFLHGVEGSARENGAALAALAADGIAVFPGDDRCAPIWREIAGARRSIEFGFASGSTTHAVSASPEASARSFELRIGERLLPVALAIDGAHNVRNALAAAACAHAIGIAPETIVRGLEQFRPVPGRMVRATTAGGATLIDDSYNANPDSVRAAIDTLAAQARPAVLVLGDMGEVGADGPAFHREVGAYARERGVEHLLALGVASAQTVAAFGAGGEHFDDVAALVARALRLDVPGTTLLVKGSRFMRMERVVAALTGQAAGGH